VKREVLIQGGLLLVLLAILFPRVFFLGEYAIATSLMGAWAPWDAVFGDEMRPHQNPLTIETVMAFNADFTLTKQQLSEGEWPLWNPLQFAGKPLLANYQSTVFYPPRLLHAAMPIALATTLYVLLKLWLCGMMAYGYGRVIGLSVAASRFLSVAWMMGGYTFTWAYWTPTDVAAWFPLVLIGVEFLLRGSLRRGSAALVVGAVLMLLAGHPESAFVNGLGAGLYFLIRLIAIRASIGSVSVSSSIALGAWVVALFICAMQIVPFAEYTNVSNNVAFREGAEEARHAVPTSEWVSFFVPRYFGTNAEGNFRGTYNSTFNSMMYPGIAVWFGALLLFGAWRSADRKRIIAWLSTSLIALVLAFDVSFVRSLLGLPVLSSLWQCYFLEYALFGFSVLGAMGLEAWSCRPRKPTSLLPIVTGVLSFASAILSMLTFDLGVLHSDGQDGYLLRQMGIAALVGGCSLLILYASVRLGNTRNVVSALTLVLVVDLWVAGRGLLPTTPRDQHYPKTEITNRLQELPGGARVDVVSATDIRPGLMTPYGIEEHWGYDGILPSRIIAFHAFLGDPEKAGRLSGVTHRLITDEPDAEGLPSELRIVENEAVLPRAFTVYDWNVEADSDVLLARLQGDDFDPMQTVLLERPIDTESLGEDAPSVTPAEIVSRNATNVVVRVTLDTPGVLVLLDAYYPGWSVTVDGERSEIFPVNHAFRGVALAAGEHEVVFSYMPRSFVIGMRLSSVALIAMLLTGIVVMRRVRFAR